MSKQNENEWLDSKSWQFENDWKNRLLNYNYKLDLQKMNNKYYTPEIEEFHHGFEYEVWENSAYTPEKWKSKIFEFRDNENIYNDSSNIIAIWENRGDEIRVKYLDQEDIESLGWNIDKVHKGQDQELFYKNNIVLYYRYKTKELGIFTRDPSKNEYYSKYNVDPYRIQSLIIKNKSELKKLLKQLNIE